jgi:hypothetical protein
MPLSGSEDTELIEMFADETDGSVEWEEKIDAESRKDMLHGILEHMENSGEEGELQARVLKLRYGIDEKEQEPLTIDQVSNELGITRDRVRQVEVQALRELEKVHGLREVTRDDDNFVETGKAFSPTGHRVDILSSLEPASHHHPKLSDNENKILEVMIKRGPDKRIVAKATGVAVNTAKCYMSEIRKKLDAVDYADAVRVASADLGLSS